MFDFVELTEQNDPAVFSRVSDSRVSPRYRHINTDELVSTINEMGWRNVATKMAKRNNRGLTGGRTKETVKHMLRFRNVNDQEALTKNLGVAEIIMVNSHDRTSPVKFTLGWFELVCTNGLVVSRENCGFSLRHVGINTQKVQEVIAKIVTKFPEIAEDRRRYQSITMTPSESLEFAMEAAQFRFNPEVQLNYSDLLIPRFREQDNSSLWSIFNTVQRNLMSGGFTTTDPTNEKRPIRKARRINSIDATMSVNSGLWELLDKYGRKLSPALN